MYKDNYRNKLTQTIFQGKCHTASTEQTLSIRLSQAPDSAFTYQDVHTTSNLLFANTPDAWNCVSLRYFRNLPCGRLSVPALREDIVAVRLQGVTELESRIIQRFPRCLSQPGDIVLAPRNTPSEWEWVDMSDILQIVIEPDFLACVAAETLACDPAQIEFIDCVSKDDPLVQQIGLALLGELQSGGLAGRMFVESLAHTLLIHLFRQHATRPQRVKDDTHRLAALSLKRLQDYIHEHLANDLSLKELAALAGYSPYHLTRLFKQTTGQTLHQYVIAQRVAAARELFMHEHLTGAELAAQVGFHDQSHLNRHFKRKYGVSLHALLTS